MQDEKELADDASSVSRPGRGLIAICLSFRRTASLFTAALEGGSAGGAKHCHGDWIASGCTDDNCARGRGGAGWRVAQSRRTAPGRQGGGRAAQNTYVARQTLVPGCADWARARKGPGRRGQHAPAAPASCLGRSCPDTTRRHDWPWPRFAGCQRRATRYDQTSAGGALFAA
ncbi:hypothetical protein IQ07DRAFT_636892 [Pyrenochaeta sp. DS3sAY3a]|nr:hypothetical protein IQ07DRAFT_636892 [Pyrenochaeta sp. DS3sAY3a]